MLTTMRLGFFPRVATRDTCGDTWPPTASATPAAMDLLQLVRIHALTPRTILLLLLLVASLAFWRHHDDILPATGLLHPEAAPLRVAFYTVGLGSGYFRLALDLLESASANFCRNQFVQVDYFVFSDQPVPSNFSANWHIVPEVKRGWPFDSQDRFKWMRTHALENPSYDYLLWMDADQKFERPICFDMLGELVAAAHPHYFDDSVTGYPYENRAESKAFIPAENARVQNYFSAHFFGGAYHKMLAALKTMNDWMEDDLSRSIQARVDDESYLNAYFYHNFPTVVLSRIFVWPEGYENEFPDMLARHGGRTEAAALARLMLSKPRNDP
jgi:hypothetical protein